jgi:hypothetical protein
MVESEKQKIRKEFERKESQVEVKKKMCAPPFQPSMPSSHHTLKLLTPTLCTTSAYRHHADDEVTDLCSLACCVDPAPALSNPHCSPLNPGPLNPKP